MIAVPHSVHTLAAILLCASGTGDAFGKHPRLVFVEAGLHNLGPDPPPYRDGSCVVSPRHRCIYVTRADSCDLIVFQRGAGTGWANARQHYGNSLAESYEDWHPTALAPTLDGRHLYVAGDEPSSVMTCQLGASTGLIETNVCLPGELGPSLPGLRACRGIAVSPDGKNVYVTGIRDDALVVFSRASDTGALTYLQVFQGDDIGGSEGDTEPFDRIAQAVVAEGLNAPRRLTVSHDGRHVYVAAAGAKAVAAFQRTAETGKLQFLEAMKQQRGASGMPLGAAQDVTLSPDDHHLYVACADDEVVVFRRDRETGELVWVQTMRNGAGGIDGLEYPREIAVSAKGDLVFVAAAGRRPGQSALTMFHRDAASGKLSLLQVVKDADHPEYRLQGISSVCVTPDTRNVYTTSGKHSVGVFLLRPQ